MSSGLLIAAAITSILAIALLAPVIARLAPREQRRALILVALVMLPMQPLVFYAVRMPLHGLVQAAFGEPLVNAISLTYAPLTEEPAKWLVLLLPFVRRALRPQTAVALALATGLGFGLGELWFIAHRLSGAPGVAALPFWQFGGFLTERLIVCFLHGAFIAFAFAAVANGRSFVPGALLGLALHFAVNFPILLLEIDWLGLGRATWQTLVFLWLLGITAALIGAVSRLGGGALKRAALGTAICPGCGTTYDRPWLAFNLGFKRYERCPACRKWHVV